MTRPLIKKLRLQPLWPFVLTMFSHKNGKGSTINDVTHTFIYLTPHTHFYCSMHQCLFTVDPQKINNASPHGVTSFRTALKIFFFPEEGISMRSILELLECPVCLQIPVSQEVLQCTNGHVFCRLVIQEIYKVVL